MKKDGLEREHRSVGIQMFCVNTAVIIKTVLGLLSTIDSENTQVQKKTEYTTQNSTLQH